MKKILILAIPILSAALTFAQDQRMVSYGSFNWSPNSKWLAFDQTDITRPQRITYDTAVFIMHSDGSALKRLTGEGRSEFSPAFSHDGTTLLFGVYDDRASIYDLYSTSLDGSVTMRLTSGLHHAVDPQVSPDGRWIALSANTEELPDRNPQVFLMRAGGTEQHQLTSDLDASFHGPRWSPDGKRLVYYRVLRDNNQIWSMNADGTDKKLLSHDTSSFSPSWSADGRRILFTSIKDGKAQLYSMMTDGSDVKSQGIEGIEGQWSPNGKKIVYLAGRVPDMKVYVANADGSNAVKLLP